MPDDLEAIKMHSLNVRNPQVKEEIKVFYITRKKIKRKFLKETSSIDNKDFIRRSIRSFSLISFNNVKNTLKNCFIFGNVP